MPGGRNNSVVGRHCVSAPAVDHRSDADSQSRPTDDQHRPKRLRRLDVVFGHQRPLFFLTICTANRAHLLDNPSAHEQFVAYCEKSPELVQVWVGRYVLMPDHIHVYVSAEDSAALSRWVGSLKKFLAAHWRKQGQANPFWQEGFFDHALRSGESYGEKWEYVRQNPWRAKLALAPEQWPYAGEIHHLEWEGNK